MNDNQKVGQERKKTNLLTLQQMKKDNVVKNFNKILTFS